MRTRRAASRWRTPASSSALAPDGDRDRLWLRPSRSSTRRGGAPYIDAIVSRQLVNNASCPLGPGTKHAGGV